MELHLKIIGFILILLAILHAAFPKHFNWKAELSPLSLINKQMMFVHTFFIALTVMLMGMMCLFLSNDLINTQFGRYLSFGLFIFWGFRLVFQFLVYSPKLWKGKPFETMMHIIFSLIWVYLTVVFGVIFFSN